MKKNKTKLIWIVYALMLLVTVMSASASDLNNSLVVSWRLDEGSGLNALDELLNNNGSLTSSSLWNSFNKLGDFGIKNEANTNRVVADDGSFVNSVPVTYRVWVWLPSGYSDVSSILHDGTTTSTEHKGVRWFISDNKMYVRVGNGACSSSGRRDYDSDYDLPTDEWFHAVLVVNSATDIDLYINKIQRNLDYGSGDASSIVFNDVTSFGGSYGCGTSQTSSNDFSLFLDDLAVWDVALSSSLIEEDYNNGSGIQLPVPSQINFSVSLVDKNTSVSIDNFSISVDGESYSTTSGSITTHLLSNDTSLYDISFYSINGSGGDASHFNFVAEDVNVSTSFEGEAEQFILNVSDVFSGVGLNGTIYADAQVCVDPPCSFINSGTFTDGVYKGVLGEPNVKERDLLLVVTDYYNKSFSDYDLLTPLITNMTPFYYLYDESFTGFFNYSSDLYVRQLNYSIRAVCPSFINSSFLVNINNESESYLPSCNNETSFLIQGTYTHDSEGLFNISFSLRNDEDNETFNVSNTTFISDLYDPVINASMIIPDGFNNVTSQLSLQCVDNVTPLILYNMTYNSDVMFFGNKTANTTQSNTSNVINGVNVLLVSCDDFFGSSSETISENVYFKTINLIDEVDNVLFDVSNLSSARLYYDDNSSFYDFKDEDKNSVNFTSTNISQLRLELGYPENVFITRWIDVALFNNIDPIRLCANKDNVVHFEQFITSSVPKTVFLKNIYANCYVAGDKTRFAFKDALILRAYTITGSYSLFTVTGLEQVLLASVDGAIQSDIFLDQLQFRRETFTVSILPDLISFSKKDTPDGSLRIYYLNTNLDNYGLTINIKNGETGDLIFSESSFVNYNEANILFNYATISGINESTLLVLEVIKEDVNGQETTLRRYFNTTGSTGQFRSELAGFIALFVLIFGFTFTSSNQTFGWFGMIIAILTFGFLSFALSAWYIVFLQALSASLIIYCVVTISKDSAGGFFT